MFHKTKMTLRMNTLISLPGSLPLMSTAASRMRAFFSLTIVAGAFLSQAVAANAAKTEAKIYFVEKWDITSMQKSQVLFSMLDSTEGDDQRKLAHAAVQFVANTNYALVRKHLLDAKIP